MRNYAEIYEKWLASPEITADERAELLALAADGDEVKERFAVDLEFGTAGMRGVLGMGTNRLNTYMVKRATLGLAQYILSLGQSAADAGVVISYDTRRYSAEFATVCARVLSACGVKSYIFENVRPVPVCSFAIRQLNAAAGIMITASHNPKQYNGYKVYGPDGAQMSPEATAVVVDYINKADVFGIEEKDAHVTPSNIRGRDGYHISERIIVLGSLMDTLYFDAIKKQSLSPEAVAKVGKDIKIVYTPIHGSGYMPVTTILAEMGITVNVVEEQAQPDVNFSTVRVPNPEESDALKLGLELANRIGSDVVIGTDPDCDRMGVAVRDDSGKFVLLTGNQIGVLLMDYILSGNQKRGTLPKNAAVVKTIVTTTLTDKIAADYGATVFNVLTGFKFIGEKMTEWADSGEYTYMFGFEESYGSLAGTHARDKDAVVAAMLFAEMVCAYQCAGSSVYARWLEICKKYGYFTERGVSFTFGGLDGMDKMKAILEGVRKGKLSEIGGANVEYVSDYLAGVTTFADSSTKAITLPKTNAMLYGLEGGDWLCVRPSGTEPKLKIYVACSRTTAAASVLANDAYLTAAKEAFGL